MKVIALQRGFFDGAPREEGEVFEVPDGRKAAWYEPVEDAAPKAKPRGKAKGAEPETFSEIAQADSAALDVKGVAENS